MRISLVLVRKDANNESVSFCIRSREDRFSNPINFSQLPVKSLLFAPNYTNLYIA